MLGTEKRSCGLILLAGLEGITVVAGSLPVAWANLTSLQVLSLSLNGSGPYGSLPTNWSSMTALKQVSISNATLLGGLPDTWASLANLTSLQLQNVNFTGVPSPTLPASWGSMDRLTALVMENVRGLAGTLPSTWVPGFKNLTTVRFRGLPGVNVTANDLGGLMASNRTSGGLQHVCLEGFNLTGTLPFFNGK